MKDWYGNKKEFRVDKRSKHTFVPTIIACYYRRNNMNNDLREEKRHRVFFDSLLCLSLVCKVKSKRYDISNCTIWTKTSRPRCWRNIAKKRLRISSTRKEMVRIARVISASANHHSPIFIASYERMS